MSRARIGAALAGALALTAALYGLWSRSAPHVPGPPRPLPKVVITRLGTPSGRGSLLGIEPSLAPQDYASGAALQARLSLYFDAAQRAGLLSAQTVAILPEYTGTWLVAAEEAAPVYAAPTLAEALDALVRRNLLRFGPALIRARAHARDAVAAAVFLMKAERMAALYTDVFSALAQRYRVTIVAGSILLPAPYVQDGRVRAGRGPLYNASFVFRPDGRAAEAGVRKAHLTSEEQPFLAAGTAAALPVFDTPAGRLAVLVCADSFFPDVYRAAQAQGAQILAVPSFVSATTGGPDAWLAPWGGYNGEPAPPADTARVQADVGRIREKDAWLRYALAGRAAPAPGWAPRALNVFLRGQLWDLRGDGETLVLTGSGAVQVVPGGGQGALISLAL